MSADLEISNAVGRLYAVGAPRPFGLAKPFGQATGEERGALLEEDVRKLYEGLMLAGTKIRDLEIALRTK